MKRLRAPWLALVMVALAACAPGQSPPGTFEADTTSASTVSTTPTETTSPTTTVPPTTLPPGTEELPEEVRTQLGELIRITEEVRQLEFVEQPTVVVVDDQELAERVRDLLEEDLADLPADEALYDVLGLIGEDTDLAQLYLDLYSEQVAGYYDGDVEELVVPIAEDGFSPIQRATLVHELVHALTDQHYDFHETYVALLDADRYDEATAYQAIIEGDAVLTELLYLQGLSSEEQGEFFAESFDVDTTVFDTAPRFIRDALIFPYDTGFRFVEQLYSSGGYEAIAQVYAEPPISSEQIIDPADFPADAPIVVEPVELTIDGYELEYQSTWGELGFALMFDQVLTESVSDRAAGGWGGDTYQLYFDGEEVVFVLQYRGDSQSDADELGSALRDYVTVAMDVGEGYELDEGTAYEGEDHAWVRVDGSDLVFVAASSDEVFESVITQLLPADTEG